MKGVALRLATHAVLGLLWVLHWLPLAVLAPLGQALGLLLWAVSYTHLTLPTILRV